MKTNYRFAAAVMGSTCLLILAQPQPVRAAGIVHTSTGTDAATSGTWSSATWTNGAPTSASAGDTVNRNSSVAVTTLLDTDITVGRISDSAFGNSSVWTISSDGVHVITMDNTGSSGNASLDVASQNGLTISPNILVTNTDLNIGQSSSASSGSTITINGAITIAGSQSRTINLITSLAANGGTAAIINGSIGATSTGTSSINLVSSSPVMGTNQNFSLTGGIGGATGTGSTVTISNINAGLGGLAISGSLGQSVTSVTENSATSTLSLSGTNTNFAGSITLTSGTLSLGSATALGGNGSTTGTGGALTIAANTSINTTSATAVTMTTVNVQQWNGNFTFVGTGNLAFGAGAITMAGNTAITASASTLTENGAIGDSGGGYNLTKLGAGGLTLAAANTYSGTTTIGAAGSFASGGALTINGAAGTINTSTAISISGSGSKLLLDNTAGNVDRVKDTANVSIGLGGELSLTGNASADTTENIAGVGIGAGNSIITVSTTTSRVTTLAASSLTRTGFGTALLRGGNLNQSAATNVARITTGTTVPSGADFVGTNTLNNGATNDSTQALKIVPWLIGDSSAGSTGSNFVTYDSTLGYRVLLATEQTTLSAGSTTAANPVNAIAFNGTNTAASGITVNSLLFNTTSALNSSGASTPILTVNSGAVAQVTNTAGSIGSGWSKLLLGNGEGVITVTQNTLTLNTAVDVTSSGGLTKSGAGTLVLAASNLYAGQTTVNQGTLVVGSGAAGDLGSNTANIVLNGGTLSFARTNAGLTISNAISGVGGVTQNGAGGITILSASNSYTGATTITSGTLQLNDANAAQNSIVAITQANGLAFNTGINSFNIGGLSGAGNEALTDNGSNAVALTIGNNNNTGMTYSGSLSGAGSLVKTGTGVQTLSGSMSTFSGGSTINSGKVIVTASSIGAVGAVTSGPLGTGTITIGNGILVGNLSTGVTLNNALSFTGTNGVLATVGSVNGFSQGGNLSLGGAWSGSGTAVVGPESTGLLATITVGDNLSGFNGTVKFVGGLNTLSFSSALNTTAKFALSGSTNEQALKFATGTSSIGELSGTGGLITGASGATLSINQNTNTSYTGSIAAVNLAVTKSGTGTLSLGGVNNNTGNFSVNGGMLQFANTSALYNGGTANWTAAKINVASGATIAFNVDSSGTAGFTAGNVTTLITGIDRSVTNNGLKAGSTIAFDTSTATGNSFTIADSIQNTTSTGGGAVGLTKLGAGNLVLTGTSTYTGATSVLNGALKINGALSGATALTVGNATTGSLTPTLGGGIGAANGGSLMSLAGAATSQVYASNSGTGNIAGAVTISGTSAGGSAGHLAPGNSVGTLTVGSLTLSGGSILDYEFNGSANDFTAVGGALTINSGVGINLYQEGTTSQFTTAGTYDLFSYGSLTGSVSNLSVLNPNGGNTYTFGTATVGGTNYVTLIISSTGGGATSTTYTMTALAGSANILTGGTTSIRSTIQNTGSGSADTLNYSGLTATSGSGGTITGSPTSGGPLAQSASGTNSGLTFTGTHSGVVTVTAVGSGTNATLNTAASQTGTNTATVTVWDAAGLSASQSGSNMQASNLGGSFRASAKITSDSGLTNNQGFTNVNVNGQQIDSGSSTTVANFDSTGKLNGTYSATKNLGYDNVTTSGSAITGGTGNTANLTLTATVSGQTAGAGQVLGAPVFSGQKYGTTTVGGTSSGFGLTSNISSDPHSPTTATIINGTASAATTVLMSFDKVPAGSEPDSAFRVSDILTLSGLVKTGGTGHDGSTLTDIYVLQLSYDSTATGQKYLGWYDATQNQWVNAVAGNSTGGTYDGTGEYAGSYASYLASLSVPDQTNLAAQLGVFGYDASTHTAWAVIDHESEFAVIPEPGTWGMIISGFGMLIGIQRLRKRRVGT